MTRALRLPAALGAALATALATPAPAAAWCQLTTSQEDTFSLACVESGEPLAWRRACLSWAVDGRDGGELSSATLREVARASFDTWLAVDCDGASPDFQLREETTPALCAEAEYRTDDGNVNVIAFRPEWPDDYPPSAYAVTTVWHRPSDGEILDADVEINDEAFPWAVCPDRGCPEGEDGLRDVDLQNVLTHELGHFFGIAHSNFLGTAMDARSPRGETTKRILRTDDIDAMCGIYPPGSLPPGTSRLEADTSLTSSAAWRLLWVPSLGLD